MMSGAHRRPAPQIGTPTLSLHLAFWAPGTGPASWTLVVERFVCNIFDRISTAASTTQPKKIFEVSSPNHVENCLHLFENDYDVILASPLAFRKRDAQSDRSSLYSTVQFTFAWHSLPVQLSVEKHTEYFTVSAYIDLSARSGDVLLDGATHPLAKTICDAVERLSRIIASRSGKLHPKGKLTGDTKQLSPTDLHNLRIADRKQCDSLYQTIYYDIWDKFAEDIISIALQTEPASITSSTLDIGNVFVDFRGFSATLSKVSKEKNGNDKAQMYIREPGWFDNYGDLESEIDATGFSNKYSLEIIDDIWPFITADETHGHGLEPEPFRLHRGRKIEHTASTFLGERYIYCTALGPQPLEFQATPAPLCYFLIGKSGHRWQMGRLLDRLHHLGTVRLAALFDLDSLDIANQELRQVEDAFRDAHKCLGRNPPALDDARSALFSARSHLISADGRVRSGGLSYRVERSRYYVKQFRDGVGALRIKRIEGFQRYDHFVLRRMGATFAFIDMLGLRHDRVLAESASVNQEIQTAQQVVLQGSLNQIQKKAELLFYIFVLPYYFSFVLYEITTGSPIRSRMTVVIFIFSVTYIIWHQRTQLKGQVITRYRQLTQLSAATLPFAAFITRAILGSAIIIFLFTVVFPKIVGFFLNTH